MLLGLRSSSATIPFSIPLGFAVSFEQAGTQQRALDRLSVLSLGPPKLLKPRVSIPPGFMRPDWVVDHHELTCILPISTADSKMQDFYEQVPGVAATALAPPTAGCQIWFGHTMLEIVPHPSMIVDWIIVQQFAWQMLNLTKKGYTNTNQINFIYRPTARIMTFSLYTGLPER